MFGGDHHHGKLHLPWKRHYHHGDDASSTASEKQPLASSPSTKDNKDKQQEQYGSLGRRVMSTNARVMRVWDVRMPPAKKTMVHGVLMPTVTGTFGTQKKRRIAIEVHSDDMSLFDSPSSSLLEPQVEENDSLHEGEKVVVRFLKPRGDVHLDESSEEGDHKTVSTLGFHAADEESDGWETRYVLGLDDVEILKARGSHCEMKLGHGSDTQVRHVNFSNESEATSFQQVLNKLFKLKKKFTEQRVRDFRQLSPVSEQDFQIRILIEIVSGVGLPIADRNATDPYVIVRLGGSQEVHRTIPIYGTVNPIWTIHNGSLFILSETPETFFGSSQGLCFIVKDFDIGSKNDTLVKVFVTQEELLKGDGERKEYELLESAPDNKKRPVRGTAACSADVACSVLFSQKSCRGSLSCAFKRPRMKTSCSRSVLHLLGNQR
jgi:hypothetical protein